MIEGDDRASVRLLRGVVEERLARSGIDHPRCFMAVNDYAVMLRLLGRLDEAEEWRRRLAAVETVPIGVR